MPGDISMASEGGWAETRLPEGALGLEEPSTQALQAPSSWSKRSLGMLRILRNAFAEERAPALSFENMVHGHPRRSVAGAFFELLVLKSKGLVDVRQAQPYADIKVTKTVRPLRLCVRVCALTDVCVGVQDKFESVALSA
jgi:hypothetical protein